MLIELIIGVLALLVVNGGAAVIPLFRPRCRWHHPMLVRVLWVATLVSIPFALFLPTAMANFRIVQILGREPIYSDRFDLWMNDLIYRKLDHFADDKTQLLRFVSHEPGLTIFAIALGTAFLVAIERRRGNLAWRDYWYLLLCQIIAWLAGGCLHPYAFG